jgi:hypothetical protein
MQLPSTIASYITTTTDTATATGSNYSAFQNKRRGSSASSACFYDAAATRYPCAVLLLDDDDSDGRSPDSSPDMLGAEHELAAPPASIAIRALCSADVFGDSRCDDREECDRSGEEGPSPLDHCQCQSITADKRLCIGHYKEWWQSVCLSFVLFSHHHHLHLLPYIPL